MPWLFISAVGLLGLCLVLRRSVAEFIAEGLGRFNALTILNKLVAMAVVCLCVWRGGSKENGPLGLTGTTGVPPVEDGALSPEECDLTVGWDCGAWFVEDGATGERATAAPAGGCGAHELVVRVRLGRGGVIDDVRFLDNGAEVFAELAALKPAWLHASGWNRLRLVGRGENVRAGERFFAQVTPDGTSVRMR